MAEVLTIAAVDRTALIWGDTLKIEQVAGEFSAVCSFKLNDVAASLAIQTRDAVTVVDGGTTLFAGEVVDVDSDLLDLAVDGRRLTVLCQDYQILVEEAVVDGQEAYSAQADSAIIADLFASYRADIDATTYVSTLNASMDVVVEDVTLRQALAEICGRTGGRWYVDENKNLHYFDAESNVAAWFLSDTPDLATSFPYQHIALRLKATTLVNRVLVVGTNVRAWREDAASIAAYGTRPAVVVDSAIADATAANERGDAVLARYATPHTAYSVTTRKSGLRAGMDVRLVCGAWGVDDTLTVERLTIRWRGGVCFYELEIGEGVAAALTTGRAWMDRISRVEAGVGSIDDIVFDVDGPAAPDLQIANLSTGVTINNDGTQMVYVIVTWGSVADTDLDQYEIQISTAADFSANVQTRLHPKDGDRSERWDGLLGGTTYYVRVRALDWVGNASAWSTVRSIVSAADTIAPADPTGLTAVGTALAVYLRWTGVADADLAHYVIQRAPNSGGAPGVYATIALAKLTFFIDDSITPGTAYWYRINATDTSGNASGWVQIAGMVTPRLVTGTDADLELLDWNHTLSFSATDYNTVAWAAGTIRLSDDSTTYNISSGNTGNMGATTYIFLDTDVSVTVLQTTTTASSAVGTNRLLVAVAKPTVSGKDAEFYVMKGYGNGVFITADQIAANTITANEIAANTITATEIAAATITGSQIAANTIAAGNIAADTITAAEIAANAITAIELNANAVTADKIEAGAVTTTKLDVVVGGYNLLLNSGFNDDDDGDGVPDEWTEEATATHFTTSLDTGDKVVGASSAQIVEASGDASGEYVAYYQEVALANVPLAIGDDFVLSGYLKTASISNLGVSLYILWQDAGSSVLQTDVAAEVTGNQGWTRATVTNTIPASAVTGRVVVLVQLTANNGTGTIHFDAIKLEPGDVATAWTTGLIGHVTIDSNRVQVTDADAKVWLGKRGATLGLFGEDSSGDLQVYIDASDGRLYCAGGLVYFDENGATFPSYNGTSAQGIASVKFNVSTAIYGWVGSYYMNDAYSQFHYTEMRNKEIAGLDSFAYVVADLATGRFAVAALSAVARLGVYSDAATTYAFLDAHAPLFIDDTANANMTTGITINQGANDDELLAGKSSDVGHGIIDVAEPDTYYTVQKEERDSGGALITGLTDADGAPYFAVRIRGILGEAADTTKSAAGGGVIGLDAYVKSGTSAVACGTDANLVTIGNGNVTRFIFDAEGEMHSDAVIGVGDDWDAWDDLALAADLSRLPTAKFAEMMKYQAADFERAGLLTLSVDEDGTQHAFIRHKAMIQFMLCCFRDVGQIFETQQQRIATLETQLLAGRA